MLSFEKEGESTLIPITSSPFTLGGPSANAHIPGAFVDEYHAIIRITENIVSVEDVRSTNGVFLRIENELPLEDFDEIALGKQRFIFRTSWDSPPHHGVKNASEIYGSPLPSFARLIQILEGGLWGAIWYVEQEILISGQKGASAHISDLSVSSPHARIRFKDGEYFIDDQGSATGTFIRLESAVELVDGDTFLVGQIPISIRYP